MSIRTMTLGFVLGAVACAIVVLGRGAGEVASETSDDWAVKVFPTPVVAGEEFFVHARYEDEGGLPSLSISLQDVDPDGDGLPNIELLSERKHTGTGSFGAINHAWQLRALTPGTVTLRVHVSYEKLILCEEIPTPFEDTACPFTAWASSIRDLEVEIETAPTPTACPTHSVRLGGSGGCATITPTYTPTFTPEPTPLVGDVNGDGRIGSVDAALILQHVAGLLPALGER